MNLCEQIGEIIKLWNWAVTFRTKKGYFNWPLVLCKAKGEQRLPVKGLASLTQNELTLIWVALNSSKAPGAPLHLIIIQL